MTWGVWRRTLVALVCTGMATVAAPAAAGPPYEARYEGTDIFCTAESGPSMVELGGFFGPGGELEYGFGGVYTEESGVWVEHGTGSVTGDDFTMSLDLVGDDGEPAGTLELEGRTMPLGEPGDVDERWRDGNAQTRVTGTFQELAGLGQITGASDSLENLDGLGLTCMGAVLDITEWGTNPATRIYRNLFSSGTCMVGDDGFLSVDVWGAEAYGFLVMGFDDETEVPDLIAEGPLAYEAPSISGELPVIEPPSDPALLVSVNLEVGDLIDRGMDRWKWRNGANHQRYVRYEMSGSASVDGDELALTDCTFVDYKAMERYSSRAGQKPGGRPPVNDLPGDALALAASASEKVSTRGADVAPEAPCLVADESESWEVPFGRTVWYAFEGTGDEVTLSTSGSGFDTVMGVYHASDLTQVSCVDDVWTDESGSLEAVVTLQTEEGEAYLVQVGGFDTGAPTGPEWGSLVLARS